MLIQTGIMNSPEVIPQELQSRHFSCITGGSPYQVTPQFMAMHGIVFSAVIRIFPDPAVHLDVIV